ncbi:MAG: hypothetical protein ABW104_18975 [Candidatus Thiodiazotropha sp. 6PLUC2]
MAYVNLNPLRAGLAETPEESEYTSIKERTHLFKENSDSDKEIKTPSGLLPFAGYPRKDMPKGVPFRLVDYLELVDWTGASHHRNKRGYIPDHKPPVLDRLQIDSKHLLYMAQHFESRFKGIVGASHALKAVCRKLGFRRTPNLGSVIELLN